MEEEEKMLEKEEKLLEKEEEKKITQSDCSGLANSMEKAVIRD